MHPAQATFQHNLCQIRFHHTSSAKNNTLSSRRECFVKRACPLGQDPTPLSGPSGMRLSNHRTRLQAGAAGWHRSARLCIWMKLVTHVTMHTRFNGSVASRLSFFEDTIMSPRQDRVPIRSSQAITKWQGSRAVPKPRLAEKPGYTP